jgi:hypothetical protein
VPPNVGLHKMKEVLFITKANVLPGHEGALDRGRCARAQAYVR